MARDLCEERWEMDTKMFFLVYFAIMFFFVMIKCNCGCVRVFAEHNQEHANTDNQLANLKKRL